MSIERARAGEGPQLVEAKTYRKGGHSRADPAKYRPDGELEEWLARDPLTLTEAQLPAEEVASAMARAEKVVAEAVAAAKAAPTVQDGALTDVWADGSSTWRT